MVVCYIGLGSNIGDRQYYINTAIRKIRFLFNTRVTKISKMIHAQPVGGPPQGPYLNCVIEIQTDLSPYELLRRLQRIEADLGRVRTIKNGPRNIDLDILLYGDAQINEDSLCIPHPRMLGREFVMRSLREIAPKLVKSLNSKKVTCRLRMSRKKNKK